MTAIPVGTPAFFIVANSTQNLSLMPAGVEALAMALGAALAPWASISKLTNVNWPTDASFWTADQPTPVAAKGAAPERVGAALIGPWPGAEALARVNLTALVAMAA